MTAMTATVASSRTETMGQLLYFITLQQSAIPDYHASLTRHEAAGPFELISELTNGSMYMDSQLLLYIPSAHREITIKPNMGITTTLFLLNVIRDHLHFLSIFISSNSNHLPQSWAEIRVASGFCDLSFE
eukprot:scaffold858_cov171-Ochromonas_danica.AAC.7